MVKKWSLGAKQKRLLQPVQLNAETLWYSFSPQYNKPINADRWRRRARQPGRAAAGYL